MASSFRAWSMKKQIKKKKIKQKEKENERKTFKWSVKLIDSVASDTKINFSPSCFFGIQRKVKQRLPAAAIDPPDSLRRRPLRRPCGAGIGWIGGWRSFSF